MKRSIIFTLIIVCFITACKKDNDVSPGRPGTGEIELIKGDNQSGVFGEWLTDTILLRITSFNPNDRFKVTCVLQQGNGYGGLLGGFTTLNSTVYLDTAGYVKLRWRMGCDNTEQKIKCYVYVDSAGNWQSPYYSSPSDSVIITAKAVKPNGWCRACGYGNLTAYEPKIVTADNATLYLVNNGLFSSTDGGLNWYKLNDIPYPEEIQDLQFNSKKWMYLLTKTHGVYYSQNGQQWTAINNGILDMRDPTGFLVEDTAMFVSFYFDGPYRTTNNGGFWRKLIAGGNSQRYYFFKRHPSGRLMLFDDWDDLKVSDNNGDNWSVVNLSYLYRTYSVYDFQIDQQGLLYIGAGDATISVIDPVTYSGTRHSYYQWNASSQHINNITITNNDVYYLVNHTPAPGIYSKSNNWGLVNTGFNKPISYYYLKSNGAFLLAANDGLYFK